MRPSFISSTVPSIASFEASLRMSMMSISPPGRRIASQQADKCKDEIEIPAAERAEVAGFGAWHPQWSTPVLPTVCPKEQSQPQ
jgi:hypothetical protein